MERPTVEELIDAGFAHHQAGRLKEAESAYNSALAIEPAHAEALHLLGLIRHQTADYPQAIELLKKAVSLDPQSSQYQHNLAEAYRASGEPPAAQQAYEQAIQLDPQSVESLRGLGICFQLENRFKEAIDQWTRALAIAPDHAETLNNIGVAYRHLGRPQDAIRPFRRAIEVQPGYLEAVKSLSRAYADLQQFDEAVSLTSEFVAAHADLAEAHCAHGIALNMAGKYDDAMDACRAALRIDPNLAEAHFNLGYAFDGVGEFHGAALAYAKTAELEPDRFAPHVNLGLALMAVGQLDRAAQAFSSGSALSPDNVNVLYNLAVAYERAANYPKAIETAKRVLEIRPDWPLATAILGTLHLRMGKHSEAEACFRRALSADPNMAQAWNNLGTLFAERGQFEECLQALRKSLDLRKNAQTHDVLVFYMNSAEGLSAQEIFKEHARWDEDYGKRPQDLIPHENSPDPKRRIKIGYVSPDFRSHSVSFFISSVLARHDHKQFEVFCYDDASRPDIVTQQLRNFADQWRRTTGLTTEQLEQAIRDDGIDILVDLAGHTADNRLLVFANKPAPVQVNYLGYPNTTGLSAIDYRFTDAIADPPGYSDSIHTEALVRLPNTFLCYAPAPEAPAVGELPALKAGHVTFVSFNALTKVNSGTIALWSNVIQAVPRSRLLIKGKGFDDETTRKLFSDRFAEHGIGSDRLELIDKFPSFAQHMETYNRCDIGLEPFPYHGTTTTCEALWMGVPVITLEGKTHVSRVGASLLSGIGLSELVAHSREEYPQIAKRLAEDLPRLAELRRTMRDRMRRSPLMDSVAFTRNIEAEYREMWTAWCAKQRIPAGNSPEH